MTHPDDGEEVAQYERRKERLSEAEWREFQRGRVAETDGGDSDGWGNGETFPAPSETEYLVLPDGDEWIVSEVGIHGFAEVARSESLSCAFRHMADITEQEEAQTHAE